MGKISVNESQLSRISQNGKKSGLRSRLRARTSRLIDDSRGYAYLLELWGDARLNALKYDRENEHWKTLHHFPFSDPQDAIDHLKSVVKALGGVRTESLDKEIVSLESGDLLPPVGKHAPDIEAEEVIMVVDGKLYNTEKSEYLGESIDYPLDEMRYVFRREFRSPSGNLFAVIKGGPMSPYGKDIGPRGERKSNTTIVPIDRQTTGKMAKPSELAEALGVSKSAVSQYNSRKRELMLKGLYCEQVLEPI